MNTMSKYNSLFFLFSLLSLTLCNSAIKRSDSTAGRMNKKSIRDQAPVKGLQNGAVVATVQDPDLENESHNKLSPTFGINPCGCPYVPYDQEYEIKVARRRRLRSKRRRRKLKNVAVSNN